jgi:hypothetical protein
MLEPVHARHSDTLGLGRLAHRKAATANGDETMAILLVGPLQDGLLPSAPQSPPPPPSSLHPPSPLLSLPSAARVVMLAKP